MDNNGILPHDFRTFSHCHGYNPLAKHPFRSAAPAQPAFRSPSTSRLKGSGLGDQNAKCSDGPGVQPPVFFMGH